ncbi:putative High-mobility group box 3 protein, partial [Naja naja]
MGRRGGSFKRQSPAANQAALGGSSQREADQPPPAAPSLSAAEVHANNT